MKLFVIAALIAVSAGARLEHLEQQQRLRAYLPPSQASAGFGSQGSYGSFGAASAGQPGFDARGAFPSTSNQYLPPDHGPSAPAGSPQFAGSIYGFGAPNQELGAPSQFGQPDATPQGTNPFGAQANYQPQYVAPHSSQNIPQQPFDEQTGYHY